MCATSQVSAGTSDSFESAKGEVCGADGWICWEQALS